MWYWFAATATGAACSAAAAALHPQTSLVTYVVVAACFVCAASDASSGYVYDAVVATAAVAVAMSALFQHALVDTIEAGSVAFLIAYGIRLVSRNAGLGWGDIKLLSVAGACSSVGGSAEIVGLSFVLGAAVALPMVMLGRVKRGGIMRFAPFVAFSAALVVVAGGR